MIFWMGKTAKHLKADLHAKLDAAVNAGKWAVTIMAMLAVGREGLETALFLWAGAQATGETVQPLIGAVLGILLAIALGYLVYKGAVRLNLATFFSWTGVFLVIVAGGVLAYGVHDLQEAAILPGLNSLAFDVSAQIPPSSWYGTVLKGIFNFSPATTWLEAGVWVAYVIPTLILFTRAAFGRRGTPSRPASPAPAPAEVTHAA
jgi:high-affinity iron transporter